MNPDIIARIAPSCQTENWQKALAMAIRDPAELLRRLGLPETLLPAAEQAAGRFPLRVPLSYVERIEKCNPADPLLLQVLPLNAELDEPATGFTTDPVGDLKANPVPGLIHKYRGRVLLITTGACAIHCRYCFRRHFPYAEDSSTPTNIGRIVEYVRADCSIEEVILSGGDPLSLATSRLRELVRPFTLIPHVKRLRIHSRLPIVLPERVDGELLAWLSALPLQTVMVVHCNHAREISPRIEDILAQLSAAGLSLLNQAVLLRQINDTVFAQKALSERLFASGVMPYYLHQLDKVSGAGHFEVPVSTALRLLDELTAQLPGYLVPRLVRETAGQAAKQPLTANYL